ncbi:hypothetical protein C8R45DRAFT_947148 [Mycena sanguinolenta]|nr:hypothetical protein C8R45DRAFT_947148 [Mycena sanguinolenta]
MGKKSKGAGRGRKSKWTAEQLEFLMRKFSAFESAQRATQLPDFWAKMEREFFELWPEEDVLGIVVAEDDGSGEGPGAMAMEDTKRLGEVTAPTGSWFNNQSQKVKRQMDTVTPSKSGGLAAKLFKQLSKKRRRLQEVEIFQKRNKQLIDDTVKAKLAKRKKKAKSGDNSSSDNDESSSDGESSNSSSDDGDSSSSSDDDHISDSSDDDNHSYSDSEAGRSKASGSKPKMDLKARSKAMRLQRKVVQKLWKHATAAEKAMVREIYVQQQAHVVDDVFDKPIEDRSPEEIQSALDELPGIVAEFHAGVYAMTGWLGVTLLSGPMPNEGGAILLGRLTLADSIQDWDRVIRAVVRETRKLRALDPTTSMSNSTSIAGPSNSEPLLESLMPKKIRKNGLVKKPTKKELKAAKAAKRASAKALADAARLPSPISVPPTMAKTNAAAGDILHNGEDLMLDGLMSFDSPGDESIPVDQDDIPIDPVLRGGLTTMQHVPIDPVLHAGPTTTGLVSNATPHLAPLPSEEHSSPIVQAFGSLTTPTAKSSHVALDSAMQSFVYPSTPPQANGPAGSSVSTPCTPAAPSTSTPASNAPVALFTPTSPASRPSVPFSTPRTFTPASTCRTLAALSTQTPPAPTPSVPSSIPRASATPSSPAVPPRAASKPSVPVSTPWAPSGAPATPSTPPVQTPPSPILPPTLRAPTPPTPTHSVPPIPTPAAPVHPALSSTAFPHSRTPCNPPKVPKVSTEQKTSVARGGNRGQGARARGVREGAYGGGGRGATARDAGYTWLQTYDADGNTVPLPLDTVLLGLSRDELQQIQGVEKARVEAEAAAQVDAEWRKSLVHNPAGGVDLVIFPALPPPKSRKRDGDSSSLELPEGTKRVRRPAVSREMPIPLSARPVPGAVDTRQAKLDEELLKRLQGGNQKHEEQTAKRKRKNDGNENLAPVAKKLQAQVGIKNLSVNELNRDFLTSNPLTRIYSYLEL